MLDRAPDLPPVIVVEQTTNGWRGLTEEGEILNVAGNAEPPLNSNIELTRNGEVIGYRTLPKEVRLDVIETYLRHYNAAIIALRANDAEQALVEIELALDVAQTTRARFNRAMILLSLGDWIEGFEEFADCEQSCDVFMRPNYRAAIECGLKPWKGENIAGKRLLLVHDHGFGDTIMMLRWVSVLQKMGAQVMLLLPPELHRLATQCAPVTANSMRVLDPDYFCSLLMVMRALRVAPEDIPLQPYLKVNPALVEKWRQCIGTSARKRIGVAWSIGKHHDGDYPRTAPLTEFVEALGRDDELHSVQLQGKAEALLLDVAHHHFDDFADCAAFMSLMDEIVSIDTAAVHLAGAIGHPKVTLLLSRWASWRWLSPLYRDIRICQQDAFGDWASAFAKRIER